ncbi:MAG: S8 family serine peptidase [Bacteroidetes bacterium]|nr:S8 family serine peptidase [Bacteroidota bacterium]
MIKKIILLSTFSMLLSSQLFAQKEAPKNWFNLDHKDDKVYGVSAEKTYRELLKGKTSTPVIVAVIDGGTEVLHEDLQSVIWVNPNEKKNGIDDDNNGYIDDINGWSFIGGAKEDVNQDNLEVTRLYAKYKNLYEKVDTSKGFVSPDFEREYRYYMKIKTAYKQGSNQFFMYQGLFNNIISGAQLIQKTTNKDSLSIEELKSYKPTTQSDVMAKNAIMQGLKRSNKKYAVFSRIFISIEESKSQVDNLVNYNYNLDFNSRGKVGDNYNNANEKYYGCNRVTGPKAEHGSHVAGIIAAIRNNGIGMDGVADNVKIMVVRAVPDGDERDKDVANAIRYAVDNGAKIINMSFGKSFSSNKFIVDEAIKYAESKDVLLVHAAGNDAKNTDIDDNFPKVEKNEKGSTTWIEVGASSWKKKKYLTADFSNYGKSRVDVFAPGVDINSCIPESKYAVYSGTSMAAPVTSGVAALLKSYYPQLTSVQIKDIILKSSIKYNKKVFIPGTHKKTKLSELCKTGGIVNAYEAVLMAQKMIK